MLEICTDYSGPRGEQLIGQNSCGVNGPQRLCSGSYLSIVRKMDMGEERKEMALLAERGGRPKLD